MNTIPWRRVRRGLAQSARRQGISLDVVAKILPVLHQVIDLCGDASHSRQAVYRIGCGLLYEPVKLFVPVCPDYAHRDGKYTFEWMGSGVSLLFLKHQPFVEGLLRVLPNASVTVLLADHERELQSLRGVLGIPNTEFERNIRGTLRALQDSVPTGWEVKAFTSAFPGFTTRIWRQTEILLQSSEHRNALEADTASRGRLYDKIGYPVDPPGTRLKCTAHVAAQYVCLGEEAARAHALICNHTTTSLRWYFLALAGVLHNPVTIY
jgi:hypothetical protein